MTGRKNRIVSYANGAVEVQPRAPKGVSHDAVNIREKEAFLHGSKRIAIISEAASSGISLHADHRFANQSRRLHITLELAWSAEKMLQQFGRTHRSNQALPPHYVLLVTDVGGEQRFASSVARRLTSLGAMTRGDRRGSHGAAADLVSHNLDTPHGHAALSLMLDAVAEHAEVDQLWDRALKMLRCHRDKVPTLLGLCVINISQECVQLADTMSAPPPIAATPQQAKAHAERTSKASARHAELHEGIQRLPPGLQQYILKLQEWGRPKLQAQASARRQKGTTAERSMYGACPKAPHGYGLSWMDAGETLKQMKLLNASLLPISDADRSNVNKFLNRLLGLPVATQNALFAYYMAVFRWVVVTAKSQGRVDSGVAMIEGDSLEQLGEPEVLFQDPATSALSELIELKVDTGLSWPSARRYLHEALRDPLVKSTEFGGTTGFWRQQRSNRLVLAVELPTSSADRSRRMHRILRPTMHTSLKPQYVPGVLDILRRLARRTACTYTSMRAHTH